MSYCDFKVGDSVACIYDGVWRSERGRIYDLWLMLNNRLPIKGAIYTVTRVVMCREGIVGIDLRECPAPKGRAFSAACLRKVQRRDLSAWLSTETTFEEPKRVPARERA